MGTEMKCQLKRHINYSHILYVLHLYVLLLNVQHCCHLFNGKIANKIEGIQNSKEYYQEY